MRLLHSVVPIASGSASAMRERDVPLSGLHRPRRRCSGTHSNSQCQLFASAKLRNDHLADHVLLAQSLASRDIYPS